MFATKKTTPRLLRLVDYSDPILRKVTSSVSFPLSAEDQQIIEDMKYSIQDSQLKKANAPYHRAVGMAANQWGLDRQIFLYFPVVGQLEIIINPSYEPVSDSATGECPVLSVWERCFSIPLTVSYVKRYVVIKAKYQNELGEYCEEILSEFAARAFQHETDHLNGILSDSISTEKKVFASKKEFDIFRSTN